MGFTRSICKGLATASARSRNPFTSVARNALIRLGCVQLFAVFEKRMFWVLRKDIFEAIGAVRVEERHSDFLGYLLDPQQDHRLGDTFARKLLQRAVKLAGEIPVPVSQIDLDTWNLADLQVRRKWQGGVTDILLHSDANRLTVIIENKIDTTEHDNQLERSWTSATAHFPHDKTVGIYLTPEGEKASHPRFVSIDYGQIEAVTQELVETRGAWLGADLRVLMSHYAQMLRRHVVAESVIADLCRRIYHKHAQAIDLILEHRPDRQATLRKFLEELIKLQSELVFDQSSKELIKFALKDWDDALVLKAGQGWTPSGRMLLFEFQNRPESLKLKLIIGPGPRDTRERLLKIALDNRPPFKPQANYLNKFNNEIYSLDFLSAKAYSDTTDQELEAKIREHWTHFLERELPILRKFEWAGQGAASLLL
jgi:hypothetical protein